MRFSRKIIVSCCALVMGCAPAASQATWDEAGRCFNEGDFECAYSNAVGLAEAGKIVVGFDDRTTDSVIFYQSAYVELAARSEPRELIAISRPVLEIFGRQPARLPFVFGFSFLAQREICEDQSCREQFAALYCRVDGEIPPPSWRPLTDLSDISETGERYFDRVWRTAPDCAGA